IILGRPFLCTAKALINLYEEKLTLRVGSDELVFYAEKYEKSKNKQFAHAISVIDFLKDGPFSGSTTFHSDALPPSSSSVKTSEILEEFADELTLSKKVVHEENFKVYSNHLFKFDDNFTFSNVNPLFNEIDKDVKNENSNVLDSDEAVLLNTPLSNKVESSDPENDIDEIDAFLAMEVSSNFEEGYFDPEGDVIFLENLLSDDTTHNLAPKVISDHEPKQDESIHNTSITFSPRSDPLHHEFAGELLTLPSGNDREFEEYLSLMTMLCEISISQSSVIESLPESPIPVEDSEPTHEEIDIFLDVFPSIPRPPPEPPDIEKCFTPEAGILIIKEFKGVSKSHDFMTGILPTLPTLVSDLTFISSFFSFESEDTIFDPGIVTFLEPVAFSMAVSCSKNGYVKNHKKTVKNGRARTRERKSEQKQEAKARKSQIYSQLQSILVNKSQQDPKSFKYPLYF
ncbi:hypothetical protein Tco_0889224, partial [Tanacetum coccineum]